MSGRCTCGYIITINTRIYSILRSSHTHNYWYFTINSRNRILVNAIYRPCCYGALENTFKLHCQFDLYLSINCKCFFSAAFFSKICQTKMRACADKKCQSCGLSFQYFRLSDMKFMVLVPARAGINKKHAFSIIKKNINCGGGHPSGTFNYNIHVLFDAMLHSTAK